MFIGACAVGGGSGSDDDDDGSGPSGRQGQCLSIGNKKDAHRETGERRVVTPEASGNVSLAQGSREARCERAVYRSAPHRIECVGGDLVDTGDQVVGEVIAFDLDEDRVTVHGGARLRLGKRPPPPEAATP